MTRGSTPATAEATNAPSGSTPSSRAFSSLAMTSAAAPSLIPLAFPAVTVPSERNAGLSLASASVVRLGPRMLVDGDIADGNELVVEAAGRVRGRPALLRAQRERVLILARDAEALGDVLAGLPHRLEREHLLEPRVRKPPAESRVPDRLVAARERSVRLRHDERRATHRLDPTRDDDLGVSGEHGVARGDDCGETRRAEPVQRHARDRRRGGRRAARPCARRCGCPRPPGSRSRSTRRRSTPPSTPARSTAAAIAMPARSSGRTPESAPP